MAREYELDYLFVEPSGIVIPGELRTQVAVAGRDARLTAGSVVLLLDGAQPEAALHDDVLHITMQQVTQADVVAVSKLDTADPEGVASLERFLGDLGPGKTIHRVSLVSGEGLPGLLAAALPESEGR